MKVYSDCFGRAHRRSVFLLGLFFIFIGMGLFLGGEAVYASDPITNHLTGWPQMTDINESAGVLIDADTGAILYSLNRDDQMYPASITKIMTCLLAIENGQLSDTITMTEAGIQEAYLGSSNIVPVLDEEFTLEQCLYMLMLKSANDIATELAVHFGGSVEGFADMMNARAADLGCVGTHFHNANGLPDEDHYTTAYDMALILRECIKNETFRKIFGTTQYTVPATNKTPTERIYQNHCKMILPSTSFYYEYCIGGKTGYTDSAWRTLVTAAVKDGVTLICVTMHGPDTTDFVDHAALYEYGFNNFSRVSVDEYADEGRTTGTVTLPVGIDVDSLVAAEVSETRLAFTYEDNPVGQGRLELQEVIEDTTAQGGMGTDIGSARAENENTTVRTLLFVFIFFLVVLGLFLLTGWLWKLDKKRRRQRRRKRKGKIGSQKAAEAAEPMEDRRKRSRRGGDGPDTETMAPDTDRAKPAARDYEDELAYMESLADAASARTARFGRRKQPERDDYEDELNYMEALADAAAKKSSRPGRRRKGAAVDDENVLAEMEALADAAAKKSSRPGRRKKGAAADDENVLAEMEALADAAAGKGTRFDQEVGAGDDEDELAYLERLIDDREKKARKRRSAAGKRSAFGKN